MIEYLDTNRSILYLYEIENLVEFSCNPFEKRKGKLLYMF